MPRTSSPPDSITWDLAQAGKIFEASIKACGALAGWCSTIDKLLFWSGPTFLSRYDFDQQCLTSHTRGVSAVR